MDWKDLAGSLAKAGAPIIGTALGGPIGGMVGGALGNVIADALGVEPTPEAVGKAIEATPPDVLAAKLATADSEAQAKWPALAEIAKAQEEGRTARFVAGTQDNASARDMLSALVKVGSPIQWAAIVVSVIVLIGFFVNLNILLWRPFKIDDNFKDILLILIGMLAQAFGQVIQFWLGSSASSAAKDAAMRDITATSVVAASQAGNVVPMPAKAAGKK